MTTARKCGRCFGQGYTIESVYGFPAEKIDCQCQRERQQKMTTQVETAETGIEEILSPMEKFGSIVSRWFPGFEVPVEPREREEWWKVNSPPPSPVPEIRGPVRFRESLSWAHGSGHEVDAGQVGVVAWQFGARLAVWSGGVLLYAVPVDAVEVCGDTVGLPRAES